MHRTVVLMIVPAILATLASAQLPGKDAGPTPPIIIDEKGTLLKGGVPFRAFGVNYFSAFNRRLKDPSDTSYREGFIDLAQAGVPFARFTAGGFWPNEWDLYLKDKDGYYAQLDDVVRTAEQTGVGLIPSLFWYSGCVPDIVGEPRNAWGNADSKTRAFMRTYTEEVVTRYRNSPAIWAWEFGNEYNLAADLPNAAEHRPKIVPKLGTATGRSEADDLTHDMYVSALMEFAETVRALDPHRPITSGNSIPRPQAEHIRNTGNWGADSAEQFAANLRDANPDPLDLVSIHVYPHARDDRFGEAHVSFEHLLNAAIEAAGQKPVFVGEFGVGSDTPGGNHFARRHLEAIITAIERTDIPLAALWVFDLPHQNGSHDITPVNDRRQMLDSIGKANRRLRLDALANPPHRYQLAGGQFSGTIYDNTGGRYRDGNAFNPLYHALYPGENLFRDEQAGINFEHIFNGMTADNAIAMFTPRRDDCSVIKHNDHSAAVRFEAKDTAWSMESEHRYTLNGNAVDMEFTATPREDRFPLGYCAFMWASYMNHTRERRIHFYGMNDDQEGWLSFGDDTEGGGFETGTVSYHGVPDLPYEEGAQSLNIVEHPTKKFLLPFYYGLVDGDGDPDTTDDTLAYIMMFDQKEPIRLAMWNFIRDANRQPDPHSPAWDWQFVIRNPEVGKTYRYRARLLVKPFESREDVRAEYERWMASLK
jgi:hypothetical protein